MSMICHLAAASDRVIAELHSHPDAISEFVGTTQRVISIDKAWSLIHFLLTGEAWSGEMPLAFVIAGGTPVGDIDVGYGPARTIDSKTVSQIDTALRAISRATLANNWNSDAIRDAELYAVNPDDKHSELEYAGAHFDSMKAFVHALAEEKLGMIVYLC